MQGFQEVGAWNTASGFPGFGVQWRMEGGEVEGRGCVNGCTVMDGGLGDRRNALGRLMKSHPHG